VQETFVFEEQGGRNQFSVGLLTEARLRHGFWVQKNLKTRERSLQ
jgi:hypothetical protein